MSVYGVFSKGHGCGHPNAMSVLRYLPRPRVPWQPSRVARRNLDSDDLARLWGQGRYRTGPGNYNSGYSTEKTHVLEDRTVSLVPRHELEKYMPNIALGPRALVTPVSLMSARAGHRVTHDMLHSYDPFIGALDKPARVDHDAITPYDSARVGLNAATLDSRGRVYRWLRRGPFFQDDHYFRRSTMLQRGSGSVPVLPHESALMQRIVRLAQRGHLKAACEAYRSVTSVPPVAVYRALTAACVPGARLADAIAIFEDGNARLFYVARDGEVLFNVLRCAIRARHRVRVMWLYNVMRGRFYENVLVRAEIDVRWRYRISAAALAFLLDHHAAEEARAVYAYMVEDDLLDGDVHERLGVLMRQALAAGKTVQVNAQTCAGVALVRNAALSAPHVAAAVRARYTAALRDGAAASVARDVGVADDIVLDAVAKAEAEAATAATGAGDAAHARANTTTTAATTAAAVARVQAWVAHTAVDDVPTTAAASTDGTSTSTTAAATSTATVEASEAALQWLRTQFADVDVGMVLRHARFRGSRRRDLMATNMAAYVARAVRWLTLLSAQHSAHAEVPLPYLRKSRPSLTGARVRVTWLPERRRRPALLAHEETEDGRFAFHYSPDMRAVDETFAYAGDTLHGRYLAHVPVHHEVGVAAPLVAGERDTTAVSTTLQLTAPTSATTMTRRAMLAAATAAAAPARVLHDSVMAEMHARSLHHHQPPHASSSSSSSDDDDDKDGNVRRDTLLSPHDNDGSGSGSGMAEAPRNAADTSLF